jgi:hypothetical protein
MRTSDIEQRPEFPDRTWKISAAYDDALAANAAVGDLVRAGMHDADVTVMSPWPVGGPSRDPRERLLEHPVWLSALAGLTLSLLLATAAAIWAEPGSWMVYAAIGLVVGVISGTLAGALTASSPPHWHDRLLGDPLGAVTVEVRTTVDESADVAKVVMAHHDPSVVRTEAGPGPRPPTERVLWDHEDGLSPLEEIGLWFEPKERKAPPLSRDRGRHLEPERARS